MNLDLPESKFSDSGRKPWTIVRRFDQFLGVLIVPHCKVLQSINLHHSAPLEVPFPMIS